MNANYERTHRKSSDPKHIPSSAGAPSLFVYKCSSCGDEETTFVPGATFCQKCQRYMTQHRRTDSGKVAEIMNRTLDLSKPIEVKQDPIEQMWDDGLVRSNIHGEIRPILGGEPLKIHGNFSKTSWLEKVVKINGSYFRLSDIGRVLQEFI